MKSTKGKRVKGMSLVGRRILALLVLALFIVWLVKGTMFLGKVLGPTYNLAVLRDNSQYSQDYAKSIETKNSHFSDYKDYTNSLINGDDEILANYARLTSTGKFFKLLGAMLPYLLIIYLTYDFICESRETKRKKLVKRTQVQRRKAVRV